MSEMISIPRSLQDMESFSRPEFTSAMASCYGMTKAQIAYDLYKRLDQGILVRVGWGRYSFPKKRLYKYQYSDAAIDVANTICEGYEGLDFQIFELIQLNEFMNHQMTHNTIFVSIENELVDYVFDTLLKAYPGRVMLKPKADQYYRYRQDNEIIVGRLPSETPKGIDEPWKSRLEKILVDVFTDKLVSAIVPGSEKEVILDGAFSSYMLDENTMIRYAKRKGTEKRMIKVLTDYREVVIE